MNLSLPNLDRKTRQTIEIFQKSEITEYNIYCKLATYVDNHKNKKILQNIASNELKHYNFWKKISNKDIEPDIFRMLKFLILTKLLGLIFAVKLMEKGEKTAQEVYEKISKNIPEVKNIIKEENEHETKLLDLIDEEKLKYVGSMVLGLNDALIELTGVLAGLTLALQNGKLIGTAGLITGVAASFSMSASEYLSTKTEGNDRNPFKASAYTGITYLVTVIFLIFPYFIFQNYFISLFVTLLIDFIIIFLFNYYVSVVKNINFKKRFVEMSAISFGIAGLSFVVGFIIRNFLHIEI